jgi:hypothetical protein
MYLVSDNALILINLGSVFTDPREFIKLVI